MKGKYKMVGLMEKEFLPIKTETPLKGSGRTERHMEDAFIAKQMETGKSDGTEKESQYTKPTNIMLIIS